jgi:SPP1 family predicted phage head-tail adaptor
MRKRATLQRSVATSDGQGGEIESWVDVADVWLSIDPVKGYERFQAMQMQTPVTHRIVLRFRADVTTASRFVYDGRVFWVQGCLNVEGRNRFLEIKAVERA